MPSTSKAQSRLMHGVASGGIKGSGVPKKVAKDFVTADKGKSQAKLPARKVPLAAGPSMADTVMPPSMPPSSGMMKRGGV
jgi:hypothetical protein